MVTTIQIDEKLKDLLDELKIHPRETYNELITRMVSSCSTSSSDRENLIETIDILSDPETMRDIAEALERIDSGEYGIPFEEVKKELGLK